MTRPILGTTNGKPLAIDVERLVQSRLLVQGASGSGKSGAVRRLLEQTHGKLQHLVLDPEGEYATLRERFDYVLAGHGGDCPAEPRSAELLVRRLLELGTSAVIDLHEMPTRERPRFVRLFCEALIEAPRALWHDVLVVIEECHLFAPQSGREAESTSAVIDLGTRGRKRGFAFVPVTQRISDLHKSVVAQCGNRLIGRTTLDADVKRAAYELGFVGRPEARQLAELKTREFFAFGPALSEKVVKITVGDVETTIARRRGARALPPPPAPEKVRALLAKLADLPAEAAAEARSLEDVRAQLRQRDRDLAALRRDMAKAVEVGVVADPESLERARSEGAASGRREGQQALARVVASAEAGRRRAAAALDQALEAIKRASDALREPIEVPEADPRLTTREEAMAVGRASLALRPAASRDVAPRHTPAADLRALGGEARMLAVLAQHYPSGLSEAQWATLSALKRTGGTWSTYLSRLRVRVHVERQSDGLWHATDAGVVAAGVVPEAPTTPEEILSMWEGKPGMRPAVRIVRILLEHGGELPTESLAEAADLTSGAGTYGAYLSRARTAGLIATVGGMVRVAEELGVAQAKLRRLFGHLRAMPIPP